MFLFGVPSVSIASASVHTASQKTYPSFPSLPGIDEDRADRGSHDPHYGVVKNPWERIGEIDETALEKLRDDGKIRGHTYGGKYISQCSLLVFLLSQLQVRVHMQLPYK